MDGFQGFNDIGRASNGWRDLSFFRRECEIAYLICSSHSSSSNR